MKKFISILLCLVFVLLFASCGNSGEGKSIIYPLYSSPKTLDPQFSSENETALVVNNIFEGLVRLDKDGKIIPGIAKSWEISQDELTYTFHLQQGTEWYCPITMKTAYGDEFYEKFSTETVKAQDFVFACRRTIDPATMSHNANRLFAIENAAEINEGSLEPSALGVTAPDENTVVFKLKEKCEGFLRRLTESEFMPCNEDFFNRMGGRYGLSPKHILCNGPFYLSSWDSETTMTIKRNKCYAGKNTVYPSSVIFSFKNDEETVLKKLANSGFSAGIISPDSKLPKDATLIKTLENTVYGFAFNCEDETVSNKNFRLALCKSADLSLLELKDENMKPQAGLIPDNCFAGSKNYRSAVNSSPVLSNDEKSAKKHWKKALSQLEADEISVKILCTDEMDTFVRLQLQKWQKLFGMSCTITVENMPANEIASAVRKGEYQIALTGITSETENAVNFLDKFNGGGIFNCENGEYTAVVNRLLITDGDGELLSGCLTAERIILENGMFLPLYSKPEQLVVSKDIGDIYLQNSESTLCFINAKRFD